MMIQITKDQALKLWKHNNIIMRNNRLGKFTEKFNCTNYDILNNQTLDFYINLNKKEKEIAYNIINKRMILATIGSIFFCFGFMNFAIYTNSFLNKNLIFFTILFIISSFFFIKATNKEEISNFINSLGEPNE